MRETHASIIIIAIEMYVVIQRTWYLYEFLWHKTKTSNKINEIIRIRRRNVCVWKVMRFTR